MLDNQTKKRIDDCRDILVGKLPDAKAQIEQITIGLIYKFMDDMDKEAIELGGMAKFFSGNYEKFGWDSLFNAKVTATEMLGLYSEAIVSMDKNPNIPALFRNIFKNAYLPYRDPETLKMFLKTIGEFKYTHSEKLGDAFEYLLSIMGSQGDAGQFRTPRHIIDFLVAVVDPKKTDSILDPACGTAGFLISAFKHILGGGSRDEARHVSTDHQPLTPDERKRLINNFTGYDISPDMVRLSLVNLYLHGFSDPHIWEYDTLSSEERWNESFDVILANPPFMSPKGGIRPHKKFSIASNRSEVLFVDYIAEHLNPKGRAGIIVPEGVIFQSGTAYKDLRKMLVDNYLYAVVSLPAGIFNPYSGVKTSILLLDKELAKTKNEILFVKVDNDGFNLGAQRNAVKGGQLKQAADIIKHYKAGTFETSEIAHAVSKLVIAEKGDYNLSGERYKVHETSSSKYPKVAIGDIIKLSSGSGLTSNNMIVGEYPVYGGNGITGWHSKYLIEKPTIVIGRVGAYCGSIHITKPFSWITDNGLYVTEYLRDDVNQNFLALMLEKLNINRFAKVGGQPSISQSTVKEREIPIPPLSVQEEIVSEIDGYQKIIDGAKMVVSTYKPKIDINPEWEMVELGDVCDVKSGGTPDRGNDNYWNGTIPYVKTGQIYFNHIYEADEFISQEGLDNSSTRLIPSGTILMAMYGQGVTRGRVAILKIEAAINQAVAAISPNNKVIDSLFLFYQLQGLYEHLRNISESRGGNQSNLNAKMIKELAIAIPTLEIQREIVAKLENEQALVNANKELIGIFEGKIKDRIGKVWGENTSAINPAPKSPEGDLESEAEEMLMAAEPEVEYGKK